MAEHQRPEEDLTVKVAEETPGEKGNSVRHTGWERTAKATMSCHFNTFGPTFNTDDKTDAHRFDPYPSTKGFGTWLRYQHVTPWNLNFIYLCADRAGAHWNPALNTSGVAADTDTFNKGIPLGVQSLFQQFLFFRVSKIWYTISNLMLIDVRPTSSDAQETTTQVIDDIKSLQQQRNIQICRLVDREEIFGANTHRGWSLPQAQQIQRHPCTQIDPLNALHGFTYIWNADSGDGWRSTLYPGGTKIGLGDNLNGTNDSVMSNRRLDWQYEWYGSYNLPTCNMVRPQNYFTLIAPRLDMYYRLPQYSLDYTFIKWFGSQFKIWTSKRRWRSGSDYPEYFCTTSPHQMYWCLNVEGLMNSHFISTYYRLDVGCELEFCEPTLGYIGATSQEGVMNRSHCVFHNNLADGHFSQGAYDLVQPQNFNFGTKEKYWDKWHNTDMNSPIRYHWPPNLDPPKHPMTSTMRERTVNGLPMQYISEDDQLVTTLDDLGENAEGYVVESLPPDIEMTPPHDIPPSAAQEHDDLSEQVPVSSEDRFILDLMKES